MRKILNLILICFILSSCSLLETKNDGDDRYLNLIATINDRGSFKSSSDYFDIALEVGEVKEGYRFYVTVDNPRIAMYGVEVLAIEKDVDYTSQMAANAGVFENEEYTMIPGQVNMEKGFVQGLTISAQTNNENPTIYVIVSWHGKDQNITQEFFELHINNEE